MADLLNLTDDMQRYFNLLPKGIQNDIINSSAKITSLEDMKTVASAISQNEHPE